MKSQSKPLLLKQEIEVIMEIHNLPELKTISRNLQGNHGKTRKFKL